MISMGVGKMYLGKSWKKPASCQIIKSRRIPKLLTCLRMIVFNFFLDGQDVSVVDFDIGKDIVCLLTR